MRKVGFSVLAAFLGVFMVVGCHGSATPATTKPAVAEVKPDPETTLFEQIRSGKYQIGAATDALQAARSAVEKLADGKEKSLIEPANDMLDRLDEIGVTLADIDFGSTTIDDVRKAYADFDEKRLDAIESLTDALLATEDLLGIFDDLLDQAKYGSNEDLKTAADEVDTTDDALRDAIKALGGKLPADLEDESPKSS